MGLLWSTFVDFCPNFAEVNPVFAFFYIFTVRYSTSLSFTGGSIILS